MTADIILTHNQFEARVSAEGAWLERLEAGSKEILFPRQMLALDDGSQKQRGGCHVCLPNFGPGGESGLPQHGFARDETWSVIAQTPASVQLELYGNGNYQHMRAVLAYMLHDAGVDMSLVVSNEGSESFAVSPGFHPYFAANDPAVNVQDQIYATSELSDAVFINGNVSELQLSSGAYRFATTNLAQWVLWTDRLGEYVCLEPTYAGSGFEQGAQPDRAVQVVPGQEFACDFSIGITD
jgi:D-hexose-6-phosphate mutarotase